MGKTRTDFKRRNPVTREMIERHRNSVHMNKRKRILERESLADLDLLDPDDYDAVVDEAGNVIVSFTGDTE